VVVHQAQRQPFVSGKNRGPTIQQVRRFFSGENGAALIPKIVRSLPKLQRTEVPLRGFGERTADSPAFIAECLINFPSAKRASDPGGAPAG
jgi:hypothetical protein